LSAQRARMVTRLARTPLLDARVLAAMADMPREAFVDSGLVAQVYEDTALPIGHGQTISKPSIVARMLSLAMEGGHARRRGHLGRCLEIGTGCGYQAALLSRLALSVISVERLRALHDAARDALGTVPAARRQGIRLVLGDGRLGHPPNAPYDTIVSAAVGHDIPQAWLTQLAVGGRLVAPSGVGHNQALVVVDRGASGLTQRIYESVRFVPLESGVIP
jgi:protein-L-isoaspartate(D-aspartate) O-methyltransferase